MASSSTEGDWSVKITSFSKLPNRSRLSGLINIPETRIFVCKSKDDNRPCAWINDFASENEAGIFAEKWSGTYIDEQEVRCVAVRSHRTRRTPPVDTASSKSMGRRPSGTVFSETAQPGDNRRSVNEYPRTPSLTGTPRKPTNFPLNKLR